MTKYGSDNFAKCGKKVMCVFLLLEIRMLPSECYLLHLIKIGVFALFFHHLIYNHIVCSLLQPLEAETIVSPVLTEVAVH